MPKDNVSVLRPVIIALDVSLELPLVFSVISLCFGIFSSPEEAQKWLKEVRRIHDEILDEDNKESDRIYRETGLPTKTFVRTELFTDEILEANHEIYKPGMCIHVQSPEIDARNMYVHALGQAENAIANAKAFIIKNS